MLTFESFCIMSSIFYDKVNSKRLSGLVARVMFSMQKEVTSRVNPGLADLQVHDILHD